jgi:hypothetical protein
MAVLSSTVPGACPRGLSRSIAGRAFPRPAWGGGPVMKAGDQSGYTHFQGWIPSRNEERSGVWLTISGDIGQVKAAGMPL